MLRRWWWVVAVCVATGVAAAFVVSSLMTPTYDADATILVEHQLETGTANFESIQAAERRIQTFSQLVTSRPVLEPVIERLQLPVSVSELESNVSVSHQQQTQLITITVRDPDPQRAADTANAITEQFAVYMDETQSPEVGEVGTEVADTLQSLLAQIEINQERIAELEAAGEAITAAEQEELAQLQELNAQYEQGVALLTQINDNIIAAEDRLGSRVRIAEPAIAATSPASPRTALNMSLAGVMGLIIGFGLAILLGYLDDKVKTTRDLRALIDQDILATIPRHDPFDDVERAHGGQSLVGEIFQGLRTNLEFAMRGSEVRSILVTSSRQEEGKTTVAANMAVALAQDGKRIILVDADLRRPSVHLMFNGIRNHKGLSNLLHLGSADIEDSLQTTGIPNLRVLATGPLPRNPAVLLNSPTMSEVASALHEVADLVIFDSPPVPISDSLILSRLSDGIVFVVRSGKIRSGELTEEMESISRSGVPILGVVMNDSDPTSQSSLQVYQHYYAPGIDDSDFQGSARRPGWITRLLPWRA